ncbi:MAG: MFS transporter [Pseudomonadota bacterium]
MGTRSYRSECASPDVRPMTQARRGFWTAPDDSLIAAVFLSFLATAGLFYVNIMAAIVDGLVTGMGISEGQAGNIGSANIYGAAAGALASVWFVKQAPWRPLAIASLVGLILIDVLSMGITSAQLLLLMRLGHGLIGGFLVGVGFAVIARTSNPDRSFGMLLFVQFGLGGLGVLLLPQLVPVYGTPALFLALAAFSLITLMMVPFLGAYAPQAAAHGREDDTVLLAPLGFTLLAIFFFQAANMGLLAFIIRLGLDYGLERSYVSVALGLATWVALLGPLAVMILGIKIGRVWPLMIGMAITLSGTGFFHLSGQPWAYMLANCATGITWGMVIAYLLAMTADFDRAGRLSALAGFVSKMGLASGPVGAGFLLSSNFGFDVLINAALAILGVSAVIMIYPAAVLDKSKPAA